MKTYYTYILSNKRHTVFYTGVTNNIVRRTYEHKAKINHGFTWRYNCDKLRYFEEYASIKEAIAREKELKKFRRDWKFQLISRMNPTWRDLSDDWSVLLPPPTATFPLGNAARPHIKFNQR
jgi:putative endonuclease